MNEQFLARMRELLGPDYDAYVETLNNPPFRGLRANLLKIQPDALVKRQFASLSPSPFAREGFVLTGSETGLGNHIYHRQGLFYMQEPSASSAVTVLGSAAGRLGAGFMRGAGREKYTDRGADRSVRFFDRE